MKLNSQSNEPLYVQLKNIITEDIQQGKYSEGQQLPTEEEICQIYGVSRGTARKAIMELVDEGRLNRSRGKGTFVNESFIQRELFALGGFSDTKSEGQPLHPVVLSCSTIEADDAKASFFKVAAGDRLLELKRLYLLEDEPILMENTYFSLSRFPELERYIMETHSTYKTIKKYYNVEITYAEKTLELAFAKEEEAKALRVDPGIALFRVERKSYDDDNNPVHISVSLHKPNRVKFKITVDKRTK